MKVVKMDSVEKVPAASPLFTGEDVTRQVLSPDSQDFNIAVVNFGTGIKNKFHYHESDQVLVVTAGQGMVATEQEQAVVGVGDIIFAPAGEPHWHGALPDTTFSHITITRKDAKTVQVEQ